MATNGKVTEILAASSLMLALALAGCGESDTAEEARGTSSSTVDPSSRSASDASKSPGAASKLPLASAPPLAALPKASIASSTLQAVNIHRDVRRGVMLTDDGIQLDVEAPSGELGRPLELRFDVACAELQVGKRMGKWDPTLPGPDLVVQQIGAGSGPRVEATPTSWRTVAVPLKGSGPTSVSVRFKDTGDPARPTWISEPWVAYRDEAPGARPRTVLLITSDTHRADHVSALNPNSPVATPHLDALIAEGAVYTNCFSAINNTNPSHIALMTGLHPRDIKVVTNHTRLSRDADTMAERFRAEGYRCYAALSAFHLSDELSGLGQGFDRMNASFSSHRDGSETLELAAAWLEEVGDAPVFLWVHLFDVHSPYRLHPEQEKQLLEGRPDPYRTDAELGTRMDLMPGWLQQSGVRDGSFVNAMYAGEVRYLDGELGPFLENPRVSDAMIAFTADHGEGLGEQSTFWTHFGVLTSTIHVPLILRGPGVDSAVRVNAPVEMIDVGKTLLRMAGVNDEGFPGDDVREIIHEVPPPAPRFALAAHGICASIESEGWLLQLFLRRAVNRSSGLIHKVGSVSMFHLEDDPSCEMDVLLENFPRAKRMRSALIRWLSSAVPMGLNGSYALTPEQEAKLNSLGYASGGEAALRWWVPELLDREWDNSPWRIAFEGDGSQEALEDAVKPDFSGVPRPSDDHKVR